jgi:hypothetical protein
MQSWHETFAAQIGGANPAQALALAAAGETVGVPVRADLLLTDAVLLRPSEALRNTAFAVLGSVFAGGAVYALGVVLNLLGALNALANLGLGQLLMDVQLGMHGYAPLLVLAAGVATVPFAALLLLAGVLGAAPLWLFPVAILARSMRFGLLAWLLWRGGTRYRDWLARYYHGLTMVVALGLLLVVVFLLLLKYL